MRSDRLYALQGLRAIAALLVVMDHAISSLTEKAGASGDFDSFGWVLGRSGVEVFFLISGFVMIYMHHGDFARPGMPQRFMEKRIIRVVPLYWLTTLIYAGKLSLQKAVIHPYQLLYSLLFIPYVGADGLFRPIYGLGWTLNCEMFFYLIFFVSLFFPAVFGVWIIGAVFGTLLLLQQFGFIQEWFGHGAVFFWSQGIVLFFLAGVILGHLRLFLIQRDKLPRLDFTWVMGLSTALLVIFFVYDYQMKIVSFSWPEALVCTLVVVAAVLSKDRESAETGKFKSLAMSLGDASYSIYLTHSFMLGPLARLAGKFAPTCPVQIFVPICLVVCSLFGLLCYRFVEKPMLGSIRRYREQQRKLESAA